MQKQTKATSIKPETKHRVWMRDSECCVWCGRWVPEYYASAHFIPRARGGLGVEQNILTLCRDCHREFDQGTNRKELEQAFREYLNAMYENWNEKDLVYRWEL